MKIKQPKPGKVKVQLDYKTTLTLKDKSFIKRWMVKYPELKIIA